MSNPNIERESQDQVISSDLLDRARSLKPESASYAEAVETAQRKLEALASSLGVSVEVFLHQAETSSKHDDAYLQGLALQRQINFFKSQNK